MVEVLTQSKQSQNAVGHTLGVSQEKFAEKVFSPDSVHQQIVRLCDLLGIPKPKNLKSINTHPKYPQTEDITGFAVTLDYRFLEPKKEDYSLAVLRLLQSLQRFKNRRIQNDLEGRILGKIQIGQLTKECLDWCPNFGPFRIFPISTGHKWSEFSPMGAHERIKQASENESGWIEFPLSAFDCLCLFATHPKRMARKDSVCPQCPGDRFGAKDGDATSYFMPRIIHDNGPKFEAAYIRKSPDQYDRDTFSVWTGFVKKR